MLLLALLRVFVVETFTVVSDSMAPTLEEGDRVVVLKTTGIERGDLIVFHGEHLLGVQEVDRSRAGAPLARLLGADPSTAYVKRVVGVPGDRVACCTADGGLTLNGEVLDEPYRDGPTDQVSFDVTVPADRYWVLGDHRADSADSRSALGRPGGGMLRADDVIGEVAWRYWPLAEAGSVVSGAAHTKSADPRVMGDTAEDNLIGIERKEPVP